MKNTLNGFAMIEVLIAMVLLTVVFLSLLSYQISLLRYTQASYFTAVAELQLINFSEILRDIQRESYREKALSRWNYENKLLLPNAFGDWDSINDHDCRIKLKWIFRKKHAESLDEFC